MERKVDISLHANSIDGKAWGNLGNKIENNSSLDTIQWLFSLPGEEKISDATWKSFLKKQPEPVDQSQQTNRESKEKKLNEEEKEPIKKQLVQETNAQIKTVFVNRILWFIQDSLDVDIDQRNQDNILSQFNLGENQTFQDKKIILEGQYNGQKILLQYDMQTGTLGYKPYLSKQDEAQTMINISSSSNRMEMHPSQPSFDSRYRVRKYFILPLR